MSVYEQIRQAFQDIVAPEIQALKGDLRTLQVELHSTKAELLVEIRRLDEKIDSFRNEMRAEIHRLDEKIDIAIQIRERLAALEARVR